MKSSWDAFKNQSNPLLRSVFFFLLLAQTVQFLGCIVFSVFDRRRNRVPLNLMMLPASMAAFGYLPFAAMWYFEWGVIEKELPDDPPSPVEFFSQFILCGVIGDFSHYWTHRFLHSNKTLRHQVHSVHHEYEGALFSWIGMQVHPLEVFMITVAIYWPFLLFAHVLVLWTFAILATFNATCVHSGYQSGWAAFGLPFALSSSDHQHHHDVNCVKNYGNVLRIWDDMYNTYEKNKRFPVLSLFKS